MRASEPALPYEYSAHTVRVYGARLRCTEALPCGTCVWELRDPVAWDDARDEIQRVQVESRGWSVLLGWTVQELLHVLSRVERGEEGMEAVEPIPTTSEGVVRVLGELYRSRESIAEGLGWTRAAAVLRAPFLDEGAPGGSSYERFHDLAWMLHGAVRGTVMVWHFFAPFPPYMIWVLPEGGGVMIRVDIRDVRGHVRVKVVATHVPGVGSRELEGARAIQDDWRALPALMASHHRLGVAPECDMGRLTQDSLRMVVAMVMRGSPPANDDAGP